MTHQCPSDKILNLLSDNTKYRKNELKLVFHDLIGQLQEVAADGNIYSFFISPSCLGAPAMDQDVVVVGAIQTQSNKVVFLPNEEMEESETFYFFRHRVLMKMLRIGNFHRFNFLGGSCFLKISVSSFLSSFTIL